MFAFCCVLSSSAAVQGAVFVCLLGLGLQSVLSRIRQCSTAAAFNPESRPSAQGPLLKGLLKSAPN